MQDSNSNKLESRLHQLFASLCQDLSLARRLFQGSLECCPFFLQAADLFMQNLSAESEKLCGSVISIKAIFKSEPDLPKQNSGHHPLDKIENDKRR
jgi:hypothetical protein